MPALGVRLRTVLAVVAAAAVATIATAQAPPPNSGASSAVRLLGRVGRAVRSSPVWSAEYTQEYTAAGMTNGETVSGKVWVAWPDHALFRSTGAAQRLMGLEGRTIRLLDLQSRTCDDHVLTEDEWQRIPLAAVLDPASARSHFALSLDGDRHLILTPLSPGGIARVELTFGPRLLPETVSVVDPQGAVNRFEFRRWTRSTGSPPGGWLPVPPAGIVCTEEAGGRAAPEGTQPSPHR